MKYSADLILDRIRDDYNDDYLVYFEDRKGNHFANIDDYYLTGKSAIECFEQLCNDSNVKYVELQYDPVDDEELEDRIILKTAEKREVDILGYIVYVP